jgi:hypothetical protein
MSIFSDFTQRDWYRYAGFLVLNIGMTLYGSYSIITYLYRLVDNGFVLFFVPMIFISTVSFGVLYPILRRLRPGIRRFLALYVAFVVALMVLGITAAILSAILYAIQYQDFLITLGALRNYSQFILLVLGGGHLYGFPALLIIAAVNKLFSPVFFPRLAANR